MGTGSNVLHSHVLFILLFIITCVVVKTRSEFGCHYFKHNGGIIECFNSTLEEFKTFKRTYNINMNDTISQLRIIYSIDLRIIEPAFFFDGWNWKYMNQTKFKQDVRTIDLSNNNINELYDDFNGFSNVVTLNLEQNSLQTLTPYTFFGLRYNLVILNLAHNKITELNEHLFSNFLSLRCLYLNNNRIVRIHDLAFYRAGVQIEVLDLSKNFVKKFPETITKTLFKLEKFNISYNKLNEFKFVFLNDSTIDYTKQFTPLSRLTEFYINNNELYDFDIEHIEYLPNLEFIQIQENQLVCRRHEKILTFLVRLKINVTLTDEIIYSPMSCVEKQRQIADDESQQSFFQQHSHYFKMVGEFMFAVVVVLLPTIFTIYLIKCIYFRIDSRHDEMELRPF